MATTTTTARKSKIAHYAERFAVESEPGLTTAQLMLYNHDLAPVEPERRQWGTYLSCTLMSSTH